MFQLVVFFFVPVVFLCHKGPISKSAQRAFSMYHLIHWPTIYSDIRYQQTIGIIYSLQPRTKSNDRYFNQTSSSSKAAMGNQKLNLERKKNSNRRVEKWSLKVVEKYADTNFYSKKKKKVTFTY